MRYPKGYFSITKHDVLLLRTLARARWMTRRQLLALTAPDPPESFYPEKTRWRIGRFLKAELVVDTRTFTYEPVLSLTRRGLAALKLLDPEFAAAVRGLKLRPPNPRSPLRLPALALNNVWLAFRQSGCLARWRTAFDLYITGKKQGRSDLPHYDAVVDLRTSRGAYRIGIHYERLPKSNDEYARRIRAIERDDNVPLVLTIAATDRLKCELVSKFANVPKVFCVTEANLLAIPWPPWSRSTRTLWSP